MKTLLRIPLGVWITIIVFSVISVGFIIFILLFKVEQTMDVRLEATNGEVYKVDSQVIHRLTLHDHLIIRSDGKFYHVTLTKIKPGLVTIEGFKPLHSPGAIYKARFIFAHTHIYSLLFGSV